MIVLSILLALAPGSLIIWYIYQADRYERETWIPLTICFLLGMFATFPVISFQTQFYNSQPGSLPLLWSSLFRSFIVIALAEELIKFLLLIIYPYQRPFFNEPIDGIVYTLMIGMGFATLENVLYAYQFGLTTIAVRAFTAMPAHACFAIIMGYFAGKARFRPEKRGRLFAFGLGAAVLLHGLYDFFILQQFWDELILLSIAVLLLSVMLSSRMITEHQKASPFKD